MSLLHRRRDAEEIADTEPVDRFIDSLDQLDRAQLLALQAAWKAVDPRARDEAWASVRAVAATRRLTHGVDEVRDRAMHWASRADNRPPLYHLADDDLGWAQLRIAAAPAIVDAALAIALGSRLDEPSRDTLLEPWRSVIGPEAR